AYRQAQLALGVRVLRPRTGQARRAQPGLIVVQRRVEGLLDRQRVAGRDLRERGEVAEAAVVRRARLGLRVRRLLRDLAQLVRAVAGGVVSRAVGGRGGGVAAAAAGRAVLGDLRRVRLGVAAERLVEAVLQQVHVVDRVDVALVGLLLFPLGALVLRDAA